MFPEWDGEAVTRASSVNFESPRGQTLTAAMIPPTNRTATPLTMARRCQLTPRLFDAGKGRFGCPDGWRGGVLFPGEGWLTRLTRRRLPGGDLANASLVFPDPIGLAMKCSLHLGHGSLLPSGAEFWKENTDLQ